MDVIESPILEGLLVFRMCGDYVPLQLLLLDSRDVHNLVAERFIELAYLLNDPSREIHAIRLHGWCLGPISKGHNMSDRLVYGQAGGSNDGRAVLNGCQGSFLASVIGDDVSNVEADELAHSHADVDARVSGSDAGDAEYLYVLELGERQCSDECLG